MVAEPSRNSVAQRKTPSPQSVFHTAQRGATQRGGTNTSPVRSVRCTAPLATAPRQAGYSTLENERRKETR